MLTFTLDTSCVIAAVKQEPAGRDVEQLVELARAGKVVIAIASGYDVDQRRASDKQRRSNLEYLSQAPTLDAPGPFRWDMSTVDGPDVVIEDETAQLDEAISAIVLPEDRTPQDSGRRMQDVHHLIAHVMAGHDALVALDDDDMIKKRVRLWSQVGIRVITPAEAVAEARRPRADGTTPL
jgi:hypothetical protein